MLLPCGIGLQPGAWMPGRVLVLGAKLLLWVLVLVLVLLLVLLVLLDVVCGQGFIGLVLDWRALGCALRCLQFFVSI